MKNLLLKLAHGYVRHVPLGVGKGALIDLVMRLVHPKTLVATAVDGSQFELQFPGDAGWEALYFRDDFETGTSVLLRQLLRPDDVVLDIGANLGWFSVLAGRRLKGGVCLAFEPHPEFFRRLQLHCATNGVEARVRCRQLALGDHAGVVELHAFTGLGGGHSSLSDLGRSDFVTVPVEMRRLDEVLAEEQAGPVSIIKMDVEGAEKAVLAGAGALLRQAPAPIWILEMNAETSASFGYQPADLIRLVTALGRWRLWRAPGGWGAVQPMAGPDDFVHADNVFCVPEARWDRLPAQLLS